MGVEGFGIVAWALAGVLPAIIWTVVNVRRATRRRERQLVHRGSVLVWGLVAVYVAVLRAAPESSAALVLLGFGVSFLLVAGVLGWRRAYLREHDFPGSYLFARRAPFGR